MVYAVLHVKPDVVHVQRLVDGGVTRHATNVVLEVVIICVLELVWAIVLHRQIVTQLERADRNVDQYLRVIQYNIHPID